MFLGLGKKNKQQIETDELNLFKQKNQELLSKVEFQQSEIENLKKNIHSKDNELEVLRMNLAELSEKFLGISEKHLLAKTVVEAQNESIASVAKDTTHVNDHEKNKKNKFLKVKYDAQVRRAAINLIAEGCTLSELEECEVDNLNTILTEQRRSSAIENAKSVIQKYAPSIARKSGYRGDAFEFANSLTEDRWAIRQFMDKEVIRAKNRLEAEALEKDRQKTIWNDFKIVLQSKIDEHKLTLSRNIRKAYKKNEYGSIVKDSRNEEIERFLKSAKILQQSNRIKSRKKIYDFVKHWYDKNRSEFEISENAPIDGHDYEFWIAARLSQVGWSAEVTQGSGDQGVDIVASIEGLSVAIQCKRYSGSVGNKAVQEIMAGMTYYRMDHAVIISTGKYTKSAIDLARTANVHLLSHNDIPLLREIIYENSKK